MIEPSRADCTGGLWPEGVELSSGAQYMFGLGVPLGLVSSLSADRVRRVKVSLSQHAIVCVLQVSLDQCRWLG